MVNEYITINEFCEKLQVSRPTYYRWVREGLPCHKLSRAVRLDVTEVTKWIENNKNV